MNRRNRGALPRFRLRQAYGATGCEADSVGTVERCLACEAVVNRANRDAHPIPVSALCRNVCLFPQQSTASQETCRTSSVVDHGLASEAALHGWRRFRRRPILIAPDPICYLLFGTSFMRVPASLPPHLPAARH